MVSSRGLLQGGVLGVALFLVVMTGLAATRADYDPVRHFVSILSLGDGGWAMVANFVVGGLLIAGLGVGLGQRWRHGPGARWIPRSVAIAGVGLVGCGVFLPDPSMGYPPGTPNELITPLTWHGAIHYGAATVIAVALTTAVLLSIRRGMGVGATWLAAASIGVAVVVVGGCLAVLVLARFDLSLVVGLLERIGVYAGWAWLIVVGAMELRAPDRL